MPPDPNAPTPGTENQIDYDAIEKLRALADGASELWISAYHEGGVIKDEEPFDPATVLALVLKARQRDEAEKILDAISGSASHVQAVGEALDALRREK